LFFIAVAHYSLKEVVYNFSSTSPVPVGSNMSEQLGKFVTVKSKVFGSRVARVSHEGIEVYFYPVEGYDNQLYVVTDGNPLPGEMILGKTNMTGELKELSRIPFARSVYKDLGIKAKGESTFYAIKVGKVPNPRLIYTYGALLFVALLFFIPIYIEINKLRRKTAMPVGSCA